MAISDDQTLKRLRLTEDDRTLIASVPPAYAEMWSNLRNSPFSCRFEGTIVDIDVLEFIEYEAGDHPLGYVGAAILWGNVLVKTGAVVWGRVSDRLMLLAPRRALREVAIDPLARVVEIEHSGIPQFGGYQWILDKAVVDLLVGGSLNDDASQDRLRLLVDDDKGSEFWASWAWRFDRTRDERQARIRKHGPRTFGREHQAD